MGQLSESRLATVRALLSRAPDRALRELEATLASGAQRHDTMRLIHGIVSAEVLERRVQGAVFLPIAPLCTPERANPGGLVFPAAALAAIWRGLKEGGGHALELALAADPHLDAPPVEAYDELCVEAAAGLRARANAGYAAAAAALDQDMSGGAQRFAAFLDVTPVARRALDRMHEWLGRLNDARIAAARLAFRDATAVADDAGPRLMEILYAHLEEPWAVLRLVSAVMHRPADAYVAESELASFGERLLDDIDARLARVNAFDPDRGRQEGLEVGAVVRVAAHEIHEFDECLEIAKDGPWGSRLLRQKKALAQAIEARLKGAEAEVTAALPVQSAGNRRLRGHPRLSSDPDPQRAERARAILTLLHEVRSSAERLGFGTLWGKTTEEVQARLDTYIEDLLEKLRGGKAEDIVRARAYLNIAAEFLGLVSDDRAAQIVRRRIAAAA